MGESGRVGVGRGRRVCTKLISFSKILEIWTLYIAGKISFDPILRFSLTVWRTHVRMNIGDIVPLYHTEKKNKVQRRLDEFEQLFCGG